MNEDKSILHQPQPDYEKAEMDLLGMHCSVLIKNDF